MQALLEQRLTDTDSPGEYPQRLPDYSEAEIENLRSLGYIR